MGFILEDEYFLSLFFPDDHGKMIFARSKVTLLPLWKINLDEKEY